MAVAGISPYGTSGVNATYFDPPKRLYQPPKASQPSTSKPYQVTLSSEARAKAMQLQGLPVSLIVLKLGLDVKTVDQYLGITVTSTSTSTISRSTYTPPKLINTAAKSAGT